MANPQKPADEYLLELFSPAAEEAGMTATVREKSPYFGDVAVTFASDEIEIRLIADRDHYFAEIRPPRDETEWFDLSLLQMLLTGADTLDGAAIESEVRFLRECLTEVKTALGQDRWPVTKRQLQALERRRSSRRFGPPSGGT
jgi:hypothetical protein